MASKTQRLDDATIRILDWVKEKTGLAKTEIIARAIIDAYGNMELPEDVQLLIELKKADEITTTLNKIYRYKNVMLKSGRYAKKSFKRREILRKKMLDWAKHDEDDERIKQLDHEERVELEILEFREEQSKRLATTLESIVKKLRGSNGKS